MYKRASKTTIILTILFFIVIMFMFTPNLLKAQENQKNFNVPIGYWPPFAITDKMPYTGIDIDLWKEIEKRLDVNVKIKKYPWSRSLNNIRQGKSDAISGIAKRKERAEYMHYIPTPYYTCTTVFYVRKGDANKISKYKDLYNYTVGYVENSAYFLQFDKDQRLNKRAVTREIQLLEMLKAKRLDTIIGTDCQVDYELAQLGYTDLLEKAVYKPGNNVDLYVAISKESPYIKEVDKITKIIEDIVKEGLVKEFAKKYYE